MPFARPSSYTAASGITLGQIISLTEGGGYQQPQPMFKTQRAEAQSADVPIAQGEQVDCRGCELHLGNIK